MATAMILGKPGSGGGAGGFCLNYDATTPLRSIDVGGSDQEQRYATHPLFGPIKLYSFLINRLADFVTKSIENTGNDLTVQEAMKKLGLQRWL